MKKSNWLFWGVLAAGVYWLTTKSAAAAPQSYPFVGPINQPGYYPFVGPINQPAATGGGAATNPGIVPGTPMDIQTQLWDPCYSGSLVYDPQACGQSGRQTY